MCWVVLFNYYLLNYLRVFFFCSGIYLYLLCAFTLCIVEKRGNHRTMHVPPEYIYGWTFY